MRFTLIGIAAAVTLVATGASALFLPAFLSVGYAIDRNNRKATS